MKYKIIFIIKVLLAILLIYAGTYKVAQFDTFKTQMHESPLLPAFFVPYIAVIVPIFEIALGISLLLFSKLERDLLLISSSLMLFFSLYLIILYTSYDKPPCSCGGILGNMSYEIHIPFNIVFTILPLIAVFLLNKNKTETEPVSS